MLTIFQAKEHHFVEADALTWEYLSWAGGRLQETHGIEHDIASAHAQDVAGRAKYLPPRGRLLLAAVDGATAGCICLKPLSDDVAEVKRLFVRPEHRGLGVGSALVKRAVQEATDIGYRRLRLDSGDFQQEAHALYRRAGFQPIAPYPGSEIPEAYHDHWVFMELRLAD